jgi:hypothetical protein
MKKKLFLCLGLLLCLAPTLFAQTSINIPDANFKAALISLGVDTSGNGQIEPSEAASVAELNLDNKNISSLEGLQYFTNLDKLLCSNNPNLRTIDTSGLTKLRILIAEYSGVKTVDVRSSKLWILRLRGCPLVYAYLTGPSTFQIESVYGVYFEKTHLKYACISLAQYNKQWNNVDHKGFWDGLGDKLHIGTCTIQPPVGCPALTFPDSAFKTALLSYSPAIDTDGDGEICIDEALAVKQLDLNTVPSGIRSSITDLTGIEYFTNLERLIITGTKAKTITVNPLTKLTYLNLYYNRLESIRIDHLDNLEYFAAVQNSISSINITFNRKLTTCHVWGNPLSSLNTSFNTELRNLSFGGNILNVNLNNNTKLDWLQVRNGQIANIDISKNTELTRFHLINTKVSTVNTKENKKIKDYAIHESPIIEVDVRHLTLNKLSLYKNPQLRTIYMTGDHAFYSDFTTFSNLSISHAILNLQQNPNLRFVCVKNVSFYPQIVSFIKTTLGYSACNVSTNCTPLLSPSFDKFFVLGPNPTSFQMALTKVNPSVTASNADIINAATGQRVKSVKLLFGGKIGGPDKLSPIKPLPTDEISLLNAAIIPVYDIPAGQYILRVSTNYGVLTKLFVKL